MKELIDLLTPTVDHNFDPVFIEQDIRSHATHVIEVGRGMRGNGYAGLLAVLEHDELHVSCALFQFHTSAVDGSNAIYERVFHGFGPSGSLRELRHTYWGESNNSGYIYGVHGALIVDAFRELQRWFDLGL